MNGAGATCANETAAQCGSIGALSTSPAELGVLLYGTGVCVCVGGGSIEIVKNQDKLSSYDISKTTQTTSNMGLYFPLHE